MEIVYLALKDGIKTDLLNAVEHVISDMNRKLENGNTGDAKPGRIKNFIVSLEHLIVRIKNAADENFNITKIEAEDISSVISCFGSMLLEVEEPEKVEGVTLKGLLKLFSLKDTISCQTKMQTLSFMR